MLIVIIGSAIAAIGPAIGAAIMAPRTVGTIVVPTLENRYREAAAAAAKKKLVEDAVFIDGILRLEETEEEQVVVDDLLGVDLPLVALRLAQAKGLPVGGGSQMYWEEVWPRPKEEKFLLTRGEAAILQELMKGDKRVYALVLRRLRRWTEERKRVLGV